MMKKMGVKMDLPRMLGEAVFRSDIAGMKARTSRLILHLIIGFISGGIFGYMVAENFLFEANILSVITFSLVPWFVMMLVMLPMMGKGIFGVKLGPTPRVGVITLILHLIYGFSLCYFLFIHNTINVVKDESKILKKPKKEHV